MRRPVATPSDALSQLLDQIRQRHSLLMAAAGPSVVSPQPAKGPGTQLALQARLEAFGLLPEYAAPVAEQATQLLESPAFSAGAPWQAARTVLARHWRQPPAVRSAWQVWLGAPGVGATTCLSKWLVRQAGQPSPRLQVWRLDLVRPNTAEALTVIAEACGVPVSRTWPQRLPADSDMIHLVDLPGLDWQDPQTQAELHRWLQQLPQPQVHLVLNAAYEVPVWLAQIRTWASLPIADLTFSHLDEQPHWGKLWNAILGAQLPLAFLSAGQNVPGQWRAATPQELLPRQEPGAYTTPQQRPC